MGLGGPSVFSKWNESWMARRSFSCNVSILGPPGIAAKLVELTEYQTRSKERGCPLSSEITKLHHHSRYTPRVSDVRKVTVGASLLALCLVRRSIESKRSQEEIRLASTQRKTCFIQ